MQNEIIATYDEIKVVVINHGISACGKSTVSNQIINYFNKNSLQASRHSTDDYFLTPDGHYTFDVAKLGENHKKNQDAFKTDLACGINIVICDNTNLIPWQSEVYTEAARQYGYKIVFIDYLPRSAQSHISAQIVTEDRPDAHAVPSETIERMLIEYETYRELLFKCSTVDPEKHANYIWDSELKQRVRMPEPSKKFDLDELIVLEAEPLEEITEKAILQLKKIIEGNEI